MDIVVQVAATPGHWQAQILVTIKLDKIALAHVDLLEAQINYAITHLADLGLHVHLGKVVAFANILHPFPCPIGDLCWCIWVNELHSMVVPHVRLKPCVKTSSKLGSKYVP